MLQVLLVTFVTVLIAYPNPYTRYLCITLLDIELHEDVNNDSKAVLKSHLMSFDLKDSNNYRIWYHENNICNSVSQSALLPIHRSCF